MSSSLFPENHLRSTFNFTNNLHNLVTIKLDTQNFDTWQKQVILPLKGHCLIGFVDGTFPPPPATLTISTSPIPQPNPDLATWMRTDALVLSSLLSTVSPSLLPKLNHHQRSSHLWKDLIETYTNVSTAHLHHLRHQLETTFKTATMEEYINKLKEISDKLAVAGAPVDDDGLVYLLTRISENT